MNAKARTMSRMTVMFGVAAWLSAGGVGMAFAQQPATQPAPGAIITPIPIPGNPPVPGPGPAAAPSSYDQYSQQPNRGAQADTVGAFPSPSQEPFPTGEPAAASDPSQAGPAVPNIDRMQPESATAGTGTPQSRDLSYTTHLDRTAVWLGDLFHYRVFVDHAANIQFVVENLNKDTINLDPLRVVGVTSSTVPLLDGRERLIVDLTLTYLTPGLNELQIPQLSLFYFRREGTTTTSEGAAAESLTVPGPLVGIRSALVGGEVAALRDAATVSPWPRDRRYFGWLGWVGLFLLVTGGAWEGAQMMRRRKSHSGPDPRKQMVVIRARWTDSVPGDGDFGRPEVVMDFYGRTYRDLKEYLGYLLDMPTEGLLADELRAEMTKRAVSDELTERAVKVLDTCERARYAKTHADLTDAAARVVADDMREIFELGAKR